MFRRILTSVTFDPAFESYPAWTRDGSRVIFSSQRTGARNLVWQAADGTGTVEQLTESPNQQNAVAVSPDGQRFLLIKQGGGADQTTAPARIIMVQHWVEELKRLVPTK